MYIASIDMDKLTRGMAGARGKQEQSHIGYFLRLGHALLQRYALRPPLAAA